MNSGTMNNIDSVTALFGVQEAAPFAESDGRGISKILVPTNFSEYSDAAFKLAIDLAKQQNATIDLLHVSRFGDGTSELRMMQEQIARFPQAQDVEIVQSIKKGRLHDEILNAEAKDKPDLIIMSRRREGYSLFSLFRSVSAKVRKRARCSVLVVGA